MNQNAIDIQKFIVNDKKQKLTFMKTLLSTLTSVKSVLQTVKNDTRVIQITNECDNLVSIIQTTNIALKTHEQYILLTLKTFQLNHQQPMQAMPKPMQSQSKSHLSKSQSTKQNKKSNSWVSESKSWRKRKPLPHTLKSLTKRKSRLSEYPVKRSRYRSHYRISPRKYHISRRYQKSPSYTYRYRSYGTSDSNSISPRRYIRIRRRSNGSSSFRRYRRT